MTWISWSSCLYLQRARITDMSPNLKVIIFAWMSRLLRLEKSLVRYKSWLQKQELLSSILGIHTNFCVCRCVSVIPAPGNTSWSLMLCQVQLTSPISGPYLKKQSRYIPRNNAWGCLLASTWVTQEHMTFSLLWISGCKIKYHLVAKEETLEQALCCNLTYGRGLSRGDQMHPSLDVVDIQLQGWA